MNYTKAMDILKAAVKQTMKHMDDLQRTSVQRALAHLERADD